MNINTTFLLLVTVILLSFGCDTSDSGHDDGIVLTKKSAQLVNANNQFGLELFLNISAYEKEAENVMISPISVALALAMTCNGAETTTKSAMEKTLRLSGLTRDEINGTYQTLVDALKSLDPKVLLEIANAIYYRKDFDVEKDFVSINRKYYGAEIEGIDFTSPSALETINGWVNTKTHGKIPEILKEITPNQVMFLLNAIYFKGIWSKEFNKQSTSNMLFYKEDGKPVSVDMMARLDTLDYFSSDLFSSIRLPYGKGNFLMYVFLPEQGKTLNNLISQLDMENWAVWMKEFKETQNVDIRLPRLKFAYEIKLNKVLSDMGMGIAFTGGADFSGINREGGLNIDYVKHKTFVEMNEEGTEAAAVTIVAIEKNMAGPAKIPFFVNKPFLFVIAEKSTGAILFIGTVKNPAAN
jgi:serine protease inhibitor